MSTSLLFNGVRKKDAGELMSLQECNGRLELSLNNKFLAMIIHGPKRLLMLAALLCMATPAFASEITVQLQPASCKTPYLPAKAQYTREEGISILGFLIRPDGTVGNAAVISSSGSRDLDRAAMSALSLCAFRRAAEIDGAVDLWVRVTYVWASTGEEDMLRAKRSAALAAGRGSVPARYHLSLVLWQTAKTDADRDMAMVVLRSTAELGHAHAQFDLGQRYEKGDGVKADCDEALRWYEKAAAQGDPLAQQRLALGKLTG